MGIGFARESKQQPRGTPGYNAFLNLQAVMQNGVLKSLPNDWCNGYVVTPTGVHLGLTSLNTANAGLVKLKPWNQYSTDALPEWMPAPMTVGVNGISGNGNILMDTGVGTSYLTPSPSVNLGNLVTCPKSSKKQCAPDGDVISVYLPDQSNPVAFYSYVIGESGNLMQPKGVHVVKGSEVFLNTSRHVLGGMNFLYDNTNGYIGYIWNGLSSDAVGYVKPTTLFSTTTLTSSKIRARVDEKVVFTTMVVGQDPLKKPTGEITFILDDKFHHHSTLKPSGHVIFSISDLHPGIHTLIAKYSGDSDNFRSTSSMLMIEILP